MTAVDEQLAPELAQAAVALGRILDRLDAMIVRLDNPPPTRLLLRLDDLAAALGVDRRTIERERSAGRFPRPDVQIGKAPLWQPATIQRWIDGGGRP